MTTSRVILLAAYAVSLVLSRLDYCNPVLGGLPKCSLQPMQLAQNMAARLVLRASNSRHITPLLKATNY